MKAEKDGLFNCPVEAALSILGGKYKSIILYHLIGGKKRYSELQKYVLNATPKMLTNQLRELERDGVIKRDVYPVVPPRTEYSLTDYGKTLIPVLTCICDWGKKHMSDKIKGEAGD